MCKMCKPKSVSTLVAFISITTSLAGCRTVFTGIEPSAGETCEKVEVRRGGMHQRCAPHIIEFDGVRAERSCVEGTGAFQCEPPRTGTDLVFVIPGSWSAGRGTLTVEQTDPPHSACAWLGAFDSGRYDFPFEVTRQLSPPVISRFTAQPRSIDAGDSTTLEWEVIGEVTEVVLGPSSITGVPNSVPATGTQRFSPGSESTYSLTAKNNCLTAVDTVTVCVNENQEPPMVTSAGRVFPAGRLTVGGRNLTYRDCSGAAESALVFTQGTTSYPPAVDASPGSGSLEATLPDSIMPGAATVVARVGALRSAPPFPFTVQGRRNGAFREVMLRRDGMASCTSGGVSRTVTVSAGTNATSRVATFSEGRRPLWAETFVIGEEGTGAGLSPGCQHGVVVGQNTSSSRNLIVKDLRNADPPALSRSDLGRGVQVLFSPDDSVVLRKSQGRGVGFATIMLHDMQGRRALMSPGPNLACLDCNAVLAEVGGYRNVTITFEGRRLGPYRIE